MIETWLLENILAFKECGTISGASEKLHITQPSVSRALQKLEQELDVPLLERQKNRAFLNENGFLVAEYAERILNLEKDMVTRVQAQEKAKHTISVGSCAPGPKIKLGIDLAKFFADVHHEITTTSDENQLLQALQNDIYQMVVLSHPTEDSNLECHFYLAEQLFICVHAQHPLSTTKSVHFQDIDDMNFIMHASVGIWQDILNQYAPHIKLFREEDLEKLSILERSSNLPSFSSNYTQALMPDRWEDRVHIPIVDDDATQNFYLVYKKENRKRFQKLLE